MEQFLEKIRWKTLVAFWSINPEIITVTGLETTHVSNRNA